MASGPQLEGRPKGPPLPFMKRKAMIKGFDVPALLADARLRSYHPTSENELQAPTMQMLGALESFGIDSNSVHTYGFAHELLNALVFRAELGFANPQALHLLKKLGVNPPCPECLMQEEAWNMIKQEVERRKHAS